jgi:spectinomycin phosphotransferase
MREPPDIAEDLLRECLRDAYDLRAAELRFLPLGADPHTAVYRAHATGGRPYFVKLRRGPFEQRAVSIPGWLSAHGVDTLIPPIAAITGQLWTRLGPFTVVLYPFVAGKDAYETPLTERQWQAFGATIRGIHRAQLPPELAAGLPRERFDDEARQLLSGVLSGRVAATATDAAAQELLALFREQGALTLELVARAERLARELKARPRPLVLCHGDLHAGNLLLAEDRLYLVDWDTLVLAPKERDLMCIGGGLGFAGSSPEDEVRQFYQGYGPAQIDPVALAYYRYERIIQDLAVDSRLLLLSDDGGADRQQALRFVRSNFEPGSTIATAMATQNAGA